MNNQAATVPSTTAKKPADMPQRKVVTITAGNRVMNCTPESHGASTMRSAVASATIASASP